MSINLQAGATFQAIASTPSVINYTLHGDKITTGDNFQISAHGTLTGSISTLYTDASDSTIITDIHLYNTSVNPITVTIYETSTNVTAVSTDATKSIIVPLSGSASYTSAAGWQVFNANGQPQTAQGACGVSGVSGVSGVTGVPGACGVSGVVGACGISGVSGVVGACGVSGVAGACGVSGTTGSTGACGVSGVSGVIGATGPTGPAGFTTVGSSPNANGGVIASNLIQLEPSSSSFPGVQSAADKKKEDNMYYDVTANSIATLVGDGVTDNASLWTTFFAGLPVGAWVHFPAGTFVTSAEFAISADKHLRITGAGMYITTIKTITSTTANIFHINGSYWENSFEDLRFDSATTKTAGAAISIDPGAAGSAVSTNIRRCSFTNQFISIDAQGAQAANASYWDNLDIAQTPVNGRGIRINGSTINLGITNSIINCGFPPFQVAGTASIEINQSGAVQMLNLEVIGGINTLLLNANQGGSTSIAAVYGTNSFFDQSGGSTFKITGANIVNRCKFVQCGITGGNIAGAIAIEIASSGTGAAGTATAAADGIDFFDLDVYPNGGSGTINGAQITGAQGVNLSNCRISGWTNGITVTPVVSNGYTKIFLNGNKMGATNNFTTPNTTGLNLNAGSFQYGSVEIVGNDFSGSTTPLVDASTTTSGNKFINGNNGLAVQAPAMIATPATVAAVETVIYSVPIPANALTADSTIVITASGIMTATTPTILVRLRCGTAGTTADAAVCATPATAVATGTGWTAQAFMTCRSVGSGGTVMGNGWVLGTAPGKSPQTAAVTVNTTVANTLTMTVIGGGTTPVITIVNAFSQVVSQ